MDKNLSKQLSTLNKNFAEHNRIEAARLKHENANQKRLDKLFGKGVQMIDKILHPPKPPKVPKLRRPPFGGMFPVAYPVAISPGENPVPRRRAKAPRAKTAPGIQ